MRQKHPTVFGKRPILMQRFNGSIRIIYPSGKVYWTNLLGDEHDNGCTTKRTQRAAYKACIEYDGPEESDYKSYSAFLGYL